MCVKRTDWVCLDVLKVSAHRADSSIFLSAGELHSEPRMLELLLDPWGILATLVQAHCQNRGSPDPGNQIVSIDRSSDFLPPLKNHVTTGA